MSAYGRGFRSVFRKQQRKAELEAYDIFKRFPPTTGVVKLDKDIAEHIYEVRIHKEFLVLEKEKNGFPTVEVIPRDRSKNKPWVPVSEKRTADYIDKHWVDSNGGR